MRALLLSVLLCGCVTNLVDIDYSIPPPADWPRLKERITYGTVSEVREWCNIPHNVRAFNCALIYFQHSVCMIYLSHGHIQGALEHERAHCRGYDHVGDKYRSHQAWERWKKERP